MKLHCNSPYSNDKLKQMLSGRDEAFNDIETEELDDRELALIEWYKMLPQLYKDLLYLRTQHSVIEIADAYQVSRQLIYHILQKIEKQRQKYESFSLH